MSAATRYVQPEQAVTLIDVPANEETGVRRYCMRQNASIRPMLKELTSQYDTCLAITHKDEVAVTGIGLFIGECVHHVADYIAVCVLVVGI